MAKIKNALGNEDFNLDFSQEKEEVTTTEQTTTTEQSVEVPEEKPQKKVGRPKGSKGGGPKKFTAIPGDEEVAVVVKIPKLLKETINNKAKENGKTFKEVVTIALLKEFVPKEESTPSNISDALLLVAKNSYSFIHLSEEMQTPVTLQAALAANEGTVGFILSYCPEHLVDSVSKEQWFEGLKQNRNVIDKVPAKYRKAALKILSDSLKETECSTKEEESIEK